MVQAAQGIDVNDARVRRILCAYILFCFSSIMNVYAMDLSRACIYWPHQDGSMSLIISGLRSDCSLSCSKRTEGRLMADWQGIQ